MRDVLQRPGTAALTPQEAALLADDATPAGVALGVLDRALARSPGHRLFTVLAIDWARGESVRAYTSDPVAYPVGGAKPLRRDSDFFRQVMLQGQVRVSRDRDDIRAHFFDHALIASLGCESAINVPVRYQGRPLGSLNLLHQRGWYQPDMAAALMPLAALAAAVLIRPQTPGTRP